jgi:hypothetical protein
MNDGREHHPHPRRGRSAQTIQSGEEVARSVFVACRDSPIMLDGIEELLDKITLG